LVAASIALGSTVLGRYKEASRGDAALPVAILVIEVVETFRSQLALDNISAIFWNGSFQEDCFIGEEAVADVSIVLVLLSAFAPNSSDTGDSAGRSGIGLEVRIVFVGSEASSQPRNSDCVRE
jgi:hypothetical protein